MKRRARFWSQLRQAGYLLPASLTGYLWLKGLHPDLPGLGCPLRQLTGIPCPGCFLTRATSAALVADLPSSISLHAFGPLAAGVLVWWSITSVRQRRLVPLGLPAVPFGVAAVGLLAYWLMRLGLSFGLGLHGFPAFPTLGT
ncbi:MAG: DUF2752 domain-containing protein [Cyanobium sp. LacPavin_0818_WC50_MAG_67_9]|nr:DUF2752 domain-containing protein [Cyanobium sp. LacPavin_0818_WC50_MAG_67_9]